MRPTTTDSYDPLDVIKSIWVINYWVIDVDPPIMATTPAIVKAPETIAAQSETGLPTDSPTNELESESAIEAAYKYSSAAVALGVMNPSEKKSLMRFTASVSQENLTSKAGTFIDTAASLNFVS